jgi:hypothetical protein
VLCLRYITLNPALVTSDNPGQEGCVIRGDLTKLFAKYMFNVACFYSSARKICAYKRSVWY